MQRSQRRLRRRVGWGLVSQASPGLSQRPTIVCAFILLIDVQHPSHLEGKGSQPLPTSPAPAGAIFGFLPTQDLFSQKGRPNLAVVPHLFGE